MLKTKFQIFIAISIYFPSVLWAFNDCTSLSSECCWRPTSNSTAWQNHKSIDEAWYRRVFRSKVTRPPPAQSYYSSVLTSPNDHSSLESCSYCSRTGNIKLWIRHWITSSAKIKLCWSQKSGLRELIECRDLDSSRSGLIDSEQLSVQRNLPVFFSIQLHALNSTPSVNPPAALIDFLNVRSELCSLNIQKLKSTRFVLLGGSYLNKQVSKTTTTTLLPLLAPSQPPQSVVDAFFNEDDPSPNESATLEYAATSLNRIDHVMSPTAGFDLSSKTPQPTGFDRVAPPSPNSENEPQNKPKETSNQDAKNWKPNVTPWMSARDIDFLVPKVLVPRGNEWALEEEQPEEKEPPKPAFAVKSPAPLSFSNMLGWPQPTQLPTIDITNGPFSNRNRGGLQFKKLPGQFEELPGSFDEKKLPKIYSDSTLPENSRYFNLHGTSKFNPSKQLFGPAPNLVSGIPNLSGPNLQQNLPVPVLLPSLPGPTFPTSLPTPSEFPTLPGPSLIPAFSTSLVGQSNDPKPTESVAQWDKKELTAFKKNAYWPKPAEFTTTTVLPLFSSLPPKLFNPFADLFGEEFADFLDPSFNTSKYDEMEIRHEQQQHSMKSSKLDQKSLPIQQLDSKSTNDKQQLVTAQQMDGESRKLQHKMSRMEKIEKEGPDSYRMRHTTSNPLKLKPPPLLAVHARVFSSPTASNSSILSKQEGLKSGSKNSTLETGTNKKFKATNYSEAKFTRLSWEEFHNLKGKGESANETRKANSTQTKSSSRAPWSAKKQLKQCNHTGGCLFEKSSCNFTNSRTLSSNSQFRRVSVGSSNFVEARVGSGDVAVYESHVNVSSDEGFYLLFDYLEWTEGEKLSVCCHTPGRQPIELYCPFESSTNETDIRWQSERIKCEPETQRILFICENFGRRSGICALDNVRLHAEWDTEFREPCQGDQLALL